MLNNNQNLNNKNLNNQNLNNGGIELGQVREVQYVPQQVAHAPAQAQTRYLYQCQTAPDNQKSKYINKCFIAIIIIFMIASSICFIINDRNIQENKTTIELLKVNADEKSSNQRDPQGNPVVTPTFFVKDNKLYSSASPEPIFDFSELKGSTGGKGDTGEKGDPGITPKLTVKDNKLFSSTSTEPLLDLSKFKGQQGDNDLALKLYVEDNKLYSSTSPEPIFDFGNLKGKDGMDATCKSAGFPVIENHEYSKMKLATGVDLIGIGYDPIRDSYGGSFLEKSFSEMKIVTDPIDDQSHKSYDYVDRFDHNFKHNVEASASTYRDINMYRKSKTSGAGGSVGWSSFLSASASKSKTTAMTFLSEGNNAVIEYTMVDQLYEITSEQDLKKYVKQEYIDAVTDLPKYNKNDKSIVDKYDLVSYLWKDFVVNYVALGGMVLQQSIINNAQKYYEKYSKANMEGGVSGGWGPFGGSASKSKSSYSSSKDIDLKSDTTTHVLVFGANAKGDLNNPSESITNMENWGHAEWQKHFDRTEKSPTKISENVIPVWYLLEGENQEKMMDYLEDKYGSGSDDIYKMTTYFNNELRRIEDVFKNKQDDLEKKMSEIKVSQRRHARDWVTCGNDRNCDSHGKSKPTYSLPSIDEMCNSDEIPEVQKSVINHEYGSFSSYVITCWSIEITLS